MAGQQGCQPEEGCPAARACGLGWVDRAELGEVVGALTASGSEPVALTTGLVGAGGFGKTTARSAGSCQTG
jgi:hypothetical protein